MTNSSQSRTASCSLWFSSGGKPELERVLFSAPELEEALQSIRGNTTGVHRRSFGNFQWSPAVRAAAALLILSAIRRDDSAILTGEGGTPASTLDYALSKVPNWLLDMFGVDESGRPLARKLFIRSNPERKRPGPVSISVDHSYLRPENIFVYIGEKAVESVAGLETLSKSCLGGDLPSGEPAIADSELPAGAHVQGATPSKRPVLWNIVTQVEELERELAAGLLRRSIDRKFCFWGREACRAWIDICDDAQFSFFRNGLVLAEQAGGEFKPHLPSEFNLIALRPGTGRKEAAFLRSVCAATSDPQKCQGYFPVDIGRDLLQLTIEEASDVDVPKEVFFADFMNAGTMRTVGDHIRANYAPHHLFLLLGNSVGIWTQGEMFHWLSTQLAPGDQVILEVFNWSAVLSQDDGTPIFSSYFPENLFDGRAARQAIAPLLRYGLRPEQGTTELETVPDGTADDTRITNQYFRFHETVTFTVGRETITCAAGERLLLSFFYRYSIPTFRSVLSAHGLTVLKELRGEGENVLLLCTPKM